jgi:predicted secreted hydrolase
MMQSLEPRRPRRPLKFGLMVRGFVRQVTNCVLCISVFSVVSVFHAFAFDPVVPGRAIEFPRDRGAHPGHRIEWWYVTGVVENDIGFQVTFFRVRNPDAEKNPSRFSPRQLLFAHAAVSDPRNKQIVHAQKSARALEGLVEAKEGETSLRLDDWTLERVGGVYRTRIESPELSLELDLVPTQEPMLQGDRGFSRKGPSGTQASYYYSEPHLAVSGSIVSRGVRRAVKGVAWLDHEWSSELLASEAVGWDWVGANLDGGAALMAFRMRGKDGATLWSNAAVRGLPSPRPPASSMPGQASPPKGEGDQVTFTPLRRWKSPRTGVEYPVAMEVRVGDRTWRLEPILDDQELDARSSTGTLYWEGAVRITSSDGPGGLGYLELTGYGERVPF